MSRISKCLLITLFFFCSGPLAQASCLSAIHKIMGVPQKKSPVDHAHQLQLTELWAKLDLLAPKNQRIELARSNPEVRSLVNAIAKIALEVIENYYRSTYPKDHPNLEDIIAIAIEPITKSIDQYVPAKGIRYSTYLLTAARNRILSEVVVAQTIKRGEGAQPISLEAKRGETGYEFLDLIPNIEASSLKSEVEFNEFVELALPTIRRALIRLEQNSGERDRAILEMHFGLNGHQETTQTDIGIFYGISKQRVSFVIKEGKNFLAQDPEITNLWRSISE
jgi:DNA-directed RNA polymerase specialized sigma subunit